MTSTSTTRAKRPARKYRAVRNMRYLILGWLLLAGLLNYLDRSSISIAAPFMMEELGLTNTDIGLMGAVFSWTYAFCQLPAGYLIDKVGPRRMYFVAMGMWSAATALMAFGHTMAHFLTFRVLLGIGESPNSPNSSKIATQWFPREERGQAAGIWDSGSKWGSAIAPPLLTLLTLTFGWRSMFLIIGAAGVLLAVAFWAFYRAPEDSKHLSDDEYRHILAGRDDATEESVKIPWLRFFTYPQTWGLMLGFFSTIWIWNIFLTFLPLFLQNTLGVSIASTGWVAAVPYLAAALGAIFAGRVTVVLARRYKLSSMLSKKVILVGGCVALGVLLCIVPFVHNLALALLVLSLALAIVAAAQAQSWAISSDIVPDSHAARFGGIMNFGGYFGGALAPIVTGVVVDATGSYTPSFLVAGVIAVLGGVCYGLLVRKPIA